MVRRASNGAGRRGAVLLEAVLALGLLLVMVGLVSGAMYRSTSALEQMSRRATAEDLAVSVLAELEAGIRPWAGGGPEPFDEPWEEWSWRIELNAVEGDPERTERLTEVVVRIEAEEEQVAYELRQWLWERGGAGEPAAAFD